MPTTASSATNGEGAWVAAAITPAARQREAGQFLSRRMEAWLSTIDFVFGPIRISNGYDTSVCRHCVISFAHFKVHTGHKSGNT